MPSLDWQLTIVAACVAWAVYCLARRTGRLFGLGKSTGKGACGSCGTCAAIDRAAGDGAQSGFVPLESLRPERAQQDRPGS